MLKYHFNGDPLTEYYNLDGLHDIILTCDTDWAPEYAIEEILSLIEQYDVKINIFATHESAVLKRKYDFLEVGLHPDFTRPAQKEWFDKKILNLKEIYPGSVGMRSHRNFFGQNIGDLAFSAGLKYDASVFLWNEPFCQAHIDYNGMLRFSYMWEDGIHLDMKMPFDKSSINLNSPGLKILNIHPILIYLNCINEDQRRAVTKKYTDLTKAPKIEIDECVNKSYGIKSFYIEILEFIKTNSIETHFLSELTYKHINETQKSLVQ